MQAWLSHKERKACPVCRVAINEAKLQRFSTDARGPEQAPTRLLNNEPAPKSRRCFEYNIISRAVMDSIETMDCLGSYGSKIETLVKHLLFCQAIETGAKSIVFSAWADSLNSKSAK